VSDATRFGLIVAGCSAVGVAALLLNLVSARLRVPAPALLLGAAAIGVHVASGTNGPAPESVERVVSLALVVILLDGGLHIGRTRLRPVAGPVLLLGLFGTLLTTTGICLVAQPLLGLGWYPALLLGAALAPTDPAVVFSVFSGAGKGHAVTVLEGESGANDPVGIAVMSALISAGGLSGGALTDAGGRVALQLVLGLVLGVLGGLGLPRLVRRIGLIGESRYPLLVTMSGFVIFGLTAAAHGSGFLAVFVAGIVMADQPTPAQLRTREFLGALAGLGEIVAFVLLGLTVDLDTIGRTDVWVPGVVLGAVSALVIRPLAGAPWLLGSPLAAGERGFVLWAGLKGAVPVLLGTFLLTEHVAHADRLYGIVVVVVMFSVLVQGSTVPLVARWTGVRTP
jgi:potassium/hydrogen antiporter